MGDGRSELEEELQKSLDQWLQKNANVSELIVKLGMEPMKLTLLELYALAKMGRIPIDEFISSLVKKWPEYAWIDEIAEEMPEVLSYLGKKK